MVQAAAVNGSAEIMRRFLGLGANANIQGGEFGTALQRAAFYGHSSILEILLEPSANVNTKGGRFGYALMVTKAGIMRLLKYWDAKESPAVPTHEKERWTLNPSGWVWLPSRTYTVSQTIAVKYTEE